MSFANANLPISRFVANWANSKRSYETVRALIESSRMNDRIMLTDLGDSPGKLRQFKLNYYPIDCDVEGDCTDSVCDSGTVTQPKQAFFELSQCTSSKVYQLNKDDIRLVDGDMTFSDHAKAQIAAKFAAMRKVLANQILGIMIANAGLQPDGNTSRRLSFARTTDGVVTPVGLFELQRIFSDTGFDNPVILGGVEVDIWKKGVNIGGLNAQGQRIDALGTDEMFYDALVSAAYGDGGEHILAWDPSVLKFISWNRNAGMFATDYDSIDDLDALFRGGNQNYINGSILDPVYGLLWDLDVYYDLCSKSWKFKFNLEWDIFFMPDQNCNIQGVNGLFHFTTCPPKLLTCPSGDNPPSPVASQVFNWTPGSIYPLYIAGMTIGGQASQPKLNVTNIAELAAAMTANSNNITFSVSGSQIRYTGFTAITGNINGNITVTFA